MEQIDDGSSSGASRTEGELVDKLRRRQQCRVHILANDQSLHDPCQNRSDGNGPEVRVLLWYRDFPDRSDAGLLPLAWDRRRAKGTVE